MAEKKIFLCASTHEKTDKSVLVIYDFRLTIYDWRAFGLTFVR